MAMYAPNLLLEDAEGNLVDIHVSTLSSFQFRQHAGTTGGPFPMYNGVLTQYIEITTKDGVVNRYPRTPKNDTEMLDHILTYFTYTRNDFELPG
ncbi:MAG: hypothetical protein WBG77_07730 [Acinetobacter venetianus]|uniref:hypothetical protein n=1 Tax=Acinetobacter venetianus TaxID=52133 RepID=UPI003C728ED9